MNESREVESEEQNRILWLDAAKGIGIIHRIKRDKYSGTKDSSQPAQQSYYRINNSREALAFLKRKCQTLLLSVCVVFFPWIDIHPF